MPWYHGPTLLPHLETRRRDGDPQRAAVPHAGAMGQPAESRFSRLCRPDRRRQRARRRRGARSRPRARNSRVARIVTADGDLPQAIAGQSVTLTLADEIDVSRGDLLVRGRLSRPASSDQFEATIVWMYDQPMLPGRPYLLKMRHAHRDRHGGTAQVQDQRQYAGADRGEDSWSSTRSASAISSSISRWRSTPTARTATPAASS